jgi:5-methylcytosine-specific restriction enzyme subunit McrC
VGQIKLKTYFPNFFEKRYTLNELIKEAEEKDKAKWQKVLIDMLRECRWMNVYTHEKANLNFKPNSILEVYLELFTNECEKILRIGLIKKYRFAPPAPKQRHAKLGQVYIFVSHHEPGLSDRLVSLGPSLSFSRE